MRLKLAGLFALILLTSCKSDDGGVRDNNPYLTDPIVNLNLNLNLPQYNPLKFPGNSLIINQQGIKGIVIYNVNNSLYTASELSDPNHPPSSCSRMEVVGIIASCPCTTDDNEYDIVTGQHKTSSNSYPMQQYRAVRTGDVVQVTN
jgi:hypothetical protein